MVNPQSIWVFLGILIAFSLFVWRYYWKLQLMYSSSTVSFYTPDQIRAINPEETLYLSNIGKKFAKTKKIVIAGLVRDVLDKLPIIEKRAERIGKIFSAYKILIVENDSSDGTREYLLDWARRNPNVTILGCGRNAEKCTLKLPHTDGHSVYRSRIEKMAYLRNIYLREVKKYRNFDYMAVWDMDIVGSVYIDGIHNTMGHFSMDPSLGVMCAYGIYQWGPLKLYYDTYATLSLNETFHIDSKTFHDLKKGVGMQFRRGDKPVEVSSCFSGFSIYSLPIILKTACKYGTTPRDDPSGNLECEHVFFHACLGAKIKMNPSMIHLVVRND